MVASYDIFLSEIRFCHKMKYKLNGWHLMTFSYDK